MWLVWYSDRCAVLVSSPFYFFFNDTATTEIYTLSLHDALPTSARRPIFRISCFQTTAHFRCRSSSPRRSEEHTSELQSHHDIVCRLLLEKKKQNRQHESERKQRNKAKL